MTTRVRVAICAVIVAVVLPAQAGMFSRLRGGMFHIDPSQAGGTANSIDGKCNMIYTNEYGFDPNKQREVNQQEWKLTPVRPR